MTASLLNMLHGCIFLAAPSFGAEAASVLHAFRRDLWHLLTMDCSGEEGPGGIGAIEDSANAIEDSSAGDRDAGTGLTLDRFAHFALYVACLQMLLAVAGGALACIPTQAQ